MKPNTGMFRNLLLVAASLAIAASPARAGIILTLNPAFLTAAPGDLLIFDATVSAPGSNGAALFMNSDTAIVDAPLSIDDSDFALNFPWSLNPGQSWEAALFTVTVPLGTPDGLYTGDFEIDGGIDAQSFGYLTDAAFNVQVETSAPEPSTLVLIGAVLLLPAFFKRFGARPGR